MLTRLEVDGFKNLLGFTCDFGPYTCIAGPNAAGKSNIFDAIEFLSLLADHSFMEAAQKLREAGAGGADPRWLFWDDGKDDPVEREMTFVAEMLVPRHVEDDFGVEEDATTTFLRYELILRYQSPAESGYSQIGSISLHSEKLVHITKGQSKEHLPWPHSASKFRDKVVQGHRSGVAYISTDHSTGSPVVSVHQDGGSRGQARKFPAARTPRTVISTSNSVDTPTVLAARREMQQWRTLTLEPTAMRTPDPMTQTPEIGSNGSRLAAALFRMHRERGDDVYREVADAAAALTDIRSVRVDVDPQRELLSMQARLGDGPFMPARSLSDGTLRFLALCIIEADDTIGGLLCMEEPENGIHPGKIREMVNLVKDLSVDPHESPGVDNPFRQVMVNTHSPYFVQCHEHDRDKLLFAETVSVKRWGRECRTVRLLPLEGTWRAHRAGRALHLTEIMRYLNNSDNTLISAAEARGEAVYL
ncbi:AAA family ATPase [Kocuria oceani]|uniref:AAA family ATPase n=1 Tax=Kocuria oceani TaxID=988827 RepID=UPI004035E4D9